MSQVVIVGQGYVGLPLAMRAVEVGHHVVGLDNHDGRIKRLAGGESFVEDVADAEVSAALDSGRYQPTTAVERCEGFDVAVITVPTPLREGVPDLTFIEEAGAALARYVRAGATVVLESTTYPGTTEELLVPILEAGSHLVAGTDFHVGYSPERVDPGNREWSLVNTPKVVSGIDAASLVAVEGFYAGLVERTVPVASPPVAELVKLIENTFRHVNIALVNELAMFAGDLGIDVWRALDAAQTKPFGFMRFNPGPGVGGHCLPVDPSYLSWQVKRRVGETFRFVELANDVNDHMPAYVVRRLVVALNCRELSVRGRRILLLGMAYKPNTSDARESPSLVIADRLLALGADVHAVDPYVDDDRLDPRIVWVELTAEEVGAADAVVVLTNHDVFDWDVVVANARYVLDTRHCVAGAQVEQL
ncbi:MAG TPA: nucleotide sugar dehydrogenase [Acidimicrobiales bacterium]|nr:nucleotide sugar dehydrogenase [Acidimicrobiales bacterium]